MTFSLRCLLDRHDWTTDSIVVRGQTWTDGRERCRRCATPKPDSSRRFFIMGASALAVVAAAGPLEILAPAASWPSPRLGLGLIGTGSVGTELSIATRRAFVPKLIVQMYQRTPLLSAFTVDGGQAVRWPMIAGRG